MALPQSTIERYGACYLTFNLVLIATMRIQGADHASVGFTK
jgi:hypothetical protein